MTKADELWTKHRHGSATMTHHQFLAALHEYGQAVRDRDAEIVAIQSNDTKNIHFRTAVILSAKIQKEPLP